MKTTAHDMRALHTSAGSALSPLPMVTVIMPIRNEARYIARSLRAVLEQDYPADHIEVLVVDGMSNDGTREIVRRIVDPRRQSADGRSASIVLLDNPARTVPPALNIGLRHARGEVIVRVDGHCTIGADYLRCCVKALRETGADCAGGPMTTLGETRVARAIALAQSSFFGVGGAAFRTGRKQPGYVDTLAFGAYRREVFDRIGRFDEELVRNQDDEFNFRLTQAGGKIWLDPAIRSVYYSRTSLRGLWRQYFQYGFYKVRVIQKRGAVPAWRHLVPGAFVVSLLIGVLLTLLTRRSRWALSVAGSYTLASGLASMWIARRDRRSGPVLPLIFLTLHGAYGAGFLWGLYKWAHVQRRNQK